jgi:hypothetical protein
MLHLAVVRSRRMRTRVLNPSSLRDASPQRLGGVNVENLVISDFLLHNDVLKKYTRRNTITSTSYSWEVCSRRAQVVRCLSGHLPVTCLKLKLYGTFN